VFDSVVARQNLPSSRSGAGFVITVAVHAAVLALVVYYSNRKLEQKADDPDVKFFAARPPPPPPPPPPAGSSSPKVETKKVEKKPRKPQEIIQPKEIPKEKPKEAEPEPEPPEPEAAAPDAQAGVQGGTEGGTEGGQIGGQLGGVIGGTVGGTLGEVLPFGDGMTRPIPSPDNVPPRYTREALEAKIEGLMLVKCVITTEGHLENCRIIKPLPHMAEAVLTALKAWRFAPVMFQGRPVSVDYVIPVHLVMQR
jgi:protein TonB